MNKKYYAKPLDDGSFDIEQYRWTAADNQHYNRKHVSDFREVAELFQRTCRFWQFIDELAPRQRSVGRRMKPAIMESIKRREIV